MLRGWVLGSFEDVHVFVTVLAEVLATVPPVAK